MEGLACSARAQAGRGRPGCSRVPAAPPCRPVAEHVPGHRSRARLGCRAYAAPSARALRRVWVTHLRQTRAATPACASASPPPACAMRVQPRCPVSDQAGREASARALRSAARNRHPHSAQRSSLVMRGARDQQAALREAILTRHPFPWPSGIAAGREGRRTLPRWVQTPRGPAPP